MTAILLFGDLLACAWMLVASVIFFVVVPRGLYRAFGQVSRDDRIKVADETGRIFGGTAVRSFIPAAWLLARWWTS